MHYYEIVPADGSYRGQGRLTYSYDVILPNGQIVEIGLRNKKIIGFITRKVDQPSFITKPLQPCLDLVVNGVSLRFFEALYDYYPGYQGAAGKLFVPNYLKNQTSSRLDKVKNLDPPRVSALPPLNQEQNKIYRTMSKHETGPATFIIHGETGSGKTRLYLELAKDIVSSGKSVVILTPEISLTTPLAKQFSDAFPGIVIINHSGLNDSQRRLNWIKAFKATTPLISIGPRSTLFMPSYLVGLIIIDEFHDQSYKQNSAPYYNAVRAASLLSKVTGAKLIMGSATPSISEYFIAQQKNIPILRLSNQAVTNQPAKLSYSVVDLTKSDEMSRYPLLSNSLIHQLKIQLSAGKQSMVFINKRGSARTVLCQNCGFRVVCPSCDLPLAYHEDHHKLRCHTCNYSQLPPQNCPVCQSTQIIFKSPGTKMIAQNLIKLFPEANIARFDKDNLKIDRIENNYEALLSGKTDIIVGTQLITKGHDLPHLALVAILQAETGLDFPDFTSEEKSYQLIKQLFGRVNRGHTPGKVLMQTFDINSPAIKYAAQNNWHKFYDLQLKQRAQHGFPPYKHALKIEAARKTRASAQKSLDELVSKLQLNTKNIDIMGPSPSFIEKKSNNYVWQVIVKSSSRSVLTQIVKNLTGNYKTNIDPSNFL